MTVLFGEFSGRQRTVKVESNSATPLVVAIHGGSYTSAYFDVAGHSLLERAASNHIPIIALDRPGYGSTPILAEDEAGIWGQARYLTQALKKAWTEFGAGTRGMVLIGHSIGGAIAAAIASEPDGLPLLGLAVSGVGLHTPTGHGPMWNALPKQPHADLPAEVKDKFMFGPDGSFDPESQASSHQADAPAVRAELIDIVGSWNEQVLDVLGKINVPVHYRQADGDHLWIVSEDEVQGFARALMQSPRVDADLMRGSGHCMDFHTVGRALHLQQLGFALQCAAETAT